MGNWVDLNLRFKVHDSEKLRDFAATAARAFNTGRDPEWYPASDEDALHEIFVACNTHPSFLDFGVELFS